MAPYHSCYRSYKQGTTRAVLKCSVGKCWTGRDEVLAWSNRGVVELLDRSNSGAGALLDPCSNTQANVRSEALRQSAAP